MWEQIGWVVMFAFAALVILLPLLRFVFRLMTGRVTLSDFSKREWVPWLWW